jgi:hypothetical protein
MFGKCRSDYRAILSGDEEMRSFRRLDFGISEL